MPVLHLGVVEMPYAKTPGRGKAKASQITTGDVAEILEAKYHVMEVYANEQGGAVATALENSVTGAIENLMLGAPPSNNPFGEGTEAIQTAFQKFIESKAMDALGVPGVPTKASLMGVSHRFKNKRNKGKGGKTSGTARPSFDDTGLYVNSMRAWVD